MTICSLLPSATEILYALGLGDQVIGVSHECHFPPEVNSKPRVVQSAIDQDRCSSEDIDRLVRDALQHRESLYRIDTELLRHLRPQLIVTQDLCDVCAIDTGSVHDVLRSLPYRPTVLSLHPHTLSEALEDIRILGSATGRLHEAARLIEQLQARIHRVRQRLKGVSRVPRVVCVEWLSPVMACGHWVPELVELAGGHEALGEAGKPSRVVPWEAVQRAQPDALILMPCGFLIDRTRRELDVLQRQPGWETLPAVQEGRVFLVNGPAYFNQSGPRLIDGLEILATLFHPERCQDVMIPEGAAERWRRYAVGECRG